MSPLDLIDEDAVARVEPAPDDAPKLGRRRDHSRDPEILDAALDVLAETGYDGMTIDMVATRAKAGKATLYRRWPSKAELVLDAVACMKKVPLDALPDTGTLRGDLIAMIQAPAVVENGEKKLQIMAGIVSILSKAPELAEAAHAALVAPRLAANRVVFDRAVARGEISPDRDLDLIAGVSSAMVAHRVLMDRKPVDRAYLVSVIDGVILPALGAPAARD